MSEVSLRKKTSFRPKEKYHFAVALPILHHEKQRHRLHCLPVIPRIISKPMQATYSTEATVVTPDSDFFRFDHTPIRFKNGLCAGKNFDYATAVVFDIRLL